MPYIKLILLTIIQITLFVSYLPSIINTLIEGNGEKISLLKVIANLIIVVCFITYGITAYDQFVIITFSTSGVLIILHTFIMLKYKK